MAIFSRFFHFRISQLTLERVIEKTVTLHNSAQQKNFFPEFFFFKEKS